MRPRVRGSAVAFIAQLAEHALSKRKVTSSILVEGSHTVRHGVVGNISACHADARGSIPRVGVLRVFIFYFFFGTGTDAPAMPSTLCPSG